jgi:hypothetical protein
MALNHYKLTRIIGKTVRFILKYLNPLNAFERIFIRKNKNVNFQPIFIVGAPRSGTTLLYQLMTYHYRLIYFSNISSVFIKSPILFSFLTKKLFKPYQDKKLTSNYGLMKGIWAPSEAGKIFQYFFYKKNDERIKNSIVKLSSVYNAPFIAKNLRINSQLEYIHHLFPDAIFIYMQRDIQFNAQSLLIGVLEKNTDIIGNITKDEQRSRVLNSSKNENFEQVVDDIDKIDSSITSFFNTPEVNGITINYDDLCSDYEKELSKIEHLFKDNKIQLERKNVLFDLYIKASKKIKLKEEDWSLLKEITKKKANEHIN